jgi:hypothetical protein
MADWTPYKIQTPAADASVGIALAAQAAKLGGILKGDAQGNVSSAVAGTDYGYGMLKGNGPPGGTTVANLGQHYFDVQAQVEPYEYICVGATESGYVWRVYGTAGTGFQLKGRFLTLDALKEAIESGLVDAPAYGDAYLIGETQPYDCYYYSKVLNDWENIGPLGATATAGTLPKSGTVGQVLIKSSDVDYDTTWGNVLTENCIGTNMLSPEIVTTDKLAGNAVTTTKIAANAVTREKLATDALYSPVVQLTADRDITADDLGKTLYAAYNSTANTITLNLTQDISGTLPAGFEIAVSQLWYSNKTAVTFTGLRVYANGETAGIATTTSGATVTPPGRGEMMALKKMEHTPSVGDVWLLTGSWEVVS